jgi:tetratricopeptide (TPR) repeat protein
MSCCVAIIKAFRPASAVFIALLCLPSVLCAVLAQTQGQAQSEGRSQGITQDLTPSQAQLQLTQQLSEAQAAVQLKPDDAHAHYAYGELLRKCGKYRQAACEYLDAADIEPTMYVAFHQIAQMNCDPSQIDEALTYLLELDEDRPNDLMLKIALSELLERRAEYYKAARALIDVSYTDKLPPKLAPRVKARIHYLLAKARQEQGQERDFVVTGGTDVGDDETGGMPPPLPENMTRPFEPTNSEDSHAIEGTGHSTLLP